MYHWSLGLIPSCSEDPVSLQPCCITLRSRSLELTGQQSQEKTSREQRYFRKVWGSWRTFSPVEDTQTDGSRSTTYSTSPASYGISVLICVSLWFSDHNAKCVSGQKYLDAELKPQTKKVTVWAWRSASERILHSRGQLLCAVWKPIGFPSTSCPLCLHGGEEERRQRPYMKIKHFVVPLERLLSL